MERPRYTYMSMAREISIDISESKSRALAYSGKLTLDKISSTALPWMRPTWRPGSSSCKKEEECYWLVYHHSDVTLGSWISKPQATRLIVCQLDSIKVSNYWPVVRGIHKSPLSWKIVSLRIVMKENRVEWTLNQMADIFCTLQWRHSECDGVSNHRRLACLLNRLFGRRSMKTSLASLAFVMGILVGAKPLSESILDYC